MGLADEAELLSRRVNPQRLAIATHGVTLAIHLRDEAQAVGGLPGEVQFATDQIVRKAVRTGDSQQAGKALRRRARSRAPSVASLTA